jgi:hypothetical protein
MWFSQSLTLREEHRLRVFENRVLRKIFAHATMEEKGGCIWGFVGKGRRKQIIKKTCGLQSLLIYKVFNFVHT